MNRNCVAPTSLCFAMLFILFAHCCLAQIGREDESQRPVIDKLFLTSVPVAEIAEVMGFPMKPERGFLHGGGSARPLIPDGILSIFGYERDNTIIIYGLPEAIRDLREIVRFFDVPPAQLEVRAEATLAFTDEVGHRRENTFVATGRIVGSRPLFLKMTTRGIGVMEGIALDIVSASIRTEAKVNRDWAIRLSYQWKLAVVLHESGARKPVRLDKEFTSSVQVKSGETVTVTQSTTPLAAHSAQITLKLTPTLLHESEPELKGGR